MQDIALSPNDNRPKILVLIKSLGLGGAERLLVDALPYLDRNRFAYTFAYLLPWKDFLVPQFEEAGFPMTLYDPFFAPNHEVLTPRTYDFVTATEVVEHLHHPQQALETLWACLKPGGLLGIMTKQVIDKAMFSRWHYKQDPTHVCFFSQDTFAWLANQWLAKYQLIGRDVILFSKPMG